jgi:hypothetical protein
MRIEARQPVAAAPETVFARIAHFEMFEERARRRSVPVERLADDPPAWRIGVDWRGLAYSVELQVETVTAPSGYTANVLTRGVGGSAAVDIAPADRGSLLSVALHLEGQGMAGRMVMQSLSFARPALEGRLRSALAKLASEIETGDLP